MAELRINVLGGVEIVGPNERPLTRKTKAVAAFLALQHGQPQSRERIAALFWENSPEEQARTNLRQCLSTLRKHLGDGLITNAETVRLDSSAVETDVALFVDSIGRDDRDALEAAVALYRGDLLGGFGLKEEAFEAWVRAERERYRELMVGGLLKLIGQYESMRDIGSVVKHATHLLALDPINEKVHRALMSAYAAQSRYDAALKQFEVCKDVLQRELGVEPQPETSGLYREIRRQRGESAEERMDSLLQETVLDPPLPDGPSLAVLPFESKSGDDDQSFFAEGLTENIIGGLTRFREILVIGVKSALAARAHASDPRDLGRALGVAHIVEGSVRRASDRLRVAVQLIEAATGKRLWAETYDRELGDIFAVQDEITNVIVSTLAGQLEHIELRRVVTKPEEDFEAYDCLLRGRQCLNRYTWEGELEARRHFELALERRAEYSAALAGLAISYLHEYEANWCEAPEAALAQCYELAQKAVAMDEADGSARYAMASACFYRGQHELAKVHIERALELNPNDYHHICSLGWFLAFSERPSDAVACSIQAMRLNPLTPDNCLFNIGMAEYVGERYEEALAAFGRMKGWGLLRPAWIAACYAQLGRDEQASAAAAEVRALAPSDPSVPDERDIERWRAYWSRLIRFEIPNDQERFLDGLRKAGLPA